MIFTKPALLVILGMLFFASPLLAQPFNKKTAFTRADTLRGSNGPGRDWWEVTKYDLQVAFNMSDSSLQGHNTISFKVIKKGKILQIDLQEPLIIDSILYSIREEAARKIDYSSIQKEGNAYFIPAGLFSIPHTNFPGVKLSVYYHGKPRAAIRAPWDGGLVWKKDKLNRPWVTVACQGLGASVWYPCKDYQGDEPDSASMRITIPDSLVAVGNGRLRNKKMNGDGTATYHWAVVNPINNYNLVPYIGKYVNFSETFKSKKGPLDMNYWVLDYNLPKARQQFTDAPRMMKALEHWFGPYPFYKDGYQLVDAPHLGMEHQSAIAYGNNYQNGYLGRDLSGSGWGLKWDFIIVHESGHEWFANNITTRDIADMWVHEGFTNYSEILFTEYYYGKAAATAYVMGIRKNIINDIPVIGIYGVNREGSGDMYYKASNMIHTIRQVINNDSLFRKILRGLNSHFYHQVVTTKQVEDYISKQSNTNFSKVFDQYLRTTQVPVLVYKTDSTHLHYRYADCVAGFNMPLKVIFNIKQWIRPTEKWQSLRLIKGEGNALVVDPNFYIKTKKVD